MSFFLLAVFDLALRTPINATSLGGLNRDLCYLFFVDMIKNAERWDTCFTLAARTCGIRENFRQFITSIPREEALRNYKKADARYLFGNSYPHGNFLEIAQLFLTFQDENLIAMIHENIRKSNEYLILRCKLKNYPRAQIVCDAIEEAGIGRFCYWTPNEGLHFKKEFHEVLQRVLTLERFDFDNLNATQLSDALSICLNHWNLTSKIGTPSLYQGDTFFPPAASALSGLTDFSPAQTNKTNAGCWCAIQ
jgi:hypothetical protein